MSAVTVDPHYQIILDEAARQNLGVQPGRVAVQSVVGDHLEVRFLPPEHDHSLAGSLRAFAHPTSGDYSQEKQAGWETEIRERNA